MITTLFTLWILFLAALVTPGANVLLVTQLAASEHSSAAKQAAIGVAIGSTLWCLCAVLGVNAVFFAFPAVRLVLQVAGGVYLLWMATRMWWQASMISPSASTVMSSGAAFRRGLLTNVTNPKAALFFGSVFAAVMPADASWPLQAAAAALIAATSLSWHLCLAWLFSRLAVRQRYARARRTIDRTAGTIIGSLGLALLYNTLSEIGRAHR